MDREIWVRDMGGDALGSAMMVGFGYAEGTGC